MVWTFLSLQWTESLCRQRLSKFWMISGIISFAILPSTRACLRVCIRQHLIFCYSDSKMEIGQWWEVYQTLGFFFSMVKMVIRVWTNVYLYLLKLLRGKLVTFRAANLISRGAFILHFVNLQFVVLLLQAICTAPKILGWITPIIFRNIYFNIWVQVLYEYEKTDGHLSGSPMLVIVHGQR